MNEKARIPQQKRGIKTKQHIINTAIELFCQKGYYNTNSNEISKLAGVSIGCFYSYFKDKKQLFLEALNYYNGLVNEGVKSQGQIESSDKKLIISSFIRNAFMAHRILPEFHNEVEAMSIMDEDVKKMVKEEEMFEIEYTYKLLELWKPEIKTVDTKIAAFLIYNMIQRSVHKSIVSDVEIDEEDLIKVAVEMIYKYLF